MAKFFPHSIPEETPDSERKTWTALSQLDDSWHVHHSVAWQGERDGRPDDGEADFVLVHPDRGVLIVEAKGGGIERDGDRWYSIDRAATRHSIKDPFRQAQESKRALVRYIKRKLASTPRIGAGHAVVFPDLQRPPPLGPDAPDVLALCAPELNSANAAIESVCGHWGMASPIGEDLTNAISEVLHPSGIQRHTLADDVVRVNAQIEAWTTDQKRVLDGLAHNRRVLIFGGAGTGKTVLAKEKAAELAGVGQRVLLTCFNKPLADAMALEFAGTPGVEVASFHQLCRRLAKRAQAQFPHEPNLAFPENPRPSFWNDQAADLLVAAAQAIAYEVDSVIVDEGQDFSQSWWLALEMLLASGTENTFYVFADRHQAIYREDWVEPFEAARFDLFKNCRNTIPIARHVSAIWDDDPISLGAYGRPPEFVEIESEAGMARALRNVLHRIVNEGKLKPRQVAVLCQRRSDVDQLQGTKAAGLTLGSFGEWGRAVLVETVQRFKGLEADAVVLLLSSVDGDYGQATAYIGMSRASAELIVIGTSAVRQGIAWDNAAVSR